MDILGEVQWSLEVEVFDVEGSILGSLAREDTVDDKFGDIDKWSFGSHVACIFYLVATHLNFSAVGILLFSTERSHDLVVCNLFNVIHGDAVVVGDVGGFSAFDVLGGFVWAGLDALAETSEFVCIKRVPCWS